MNDPFRRGYPEDLPLRPSTSGCLDWLAHRRNLFDLRLPEALLEKRLGIITMPIREQVSLDWRWHADALESLLAIEDKVSVRARYLPGRERVGLELEVDNLSRDGFEEVRAVVCMRLVAAPDFTDPGRERTCWWADGKWQRLPGGFPQIELPPPPRPVLIVVESEPPGFVFAMGFSRTWRVGGNDQPHNLCVHADPALGDIPAGGRSRAGGRLVLSGGGREEALRIFLEGEPEVSRCT